MEAENTSLRCLITRLQDALRSERENVRHAHIQNVELERQLEDTRSELTDFKSAFQRQQEDLLLERGKFQNLKKVVATLEEFMHVQQGELQERQVQLSQCEEQIRQLEASLAETKTNNAALEKANKKLTKTLKDSLNDSARSKEIQTSCQTADSEQFDWELID